MGTGGSTAVLAVIAALAAACSVPDLSAVGRPCSNDNPCGAGTHCSPPPRTCVPGVAPADAGPDTSPPDSGARDLSPGDARDDVFVIIADAFTPPGQWKTIPAGTFIMGSPPTEACRPGPDAGVAFSKETPHKVTLTHSFAITSREVTTQQHTTIMGYAISGSTHIHYPVAGISWYEAVAYCNELSVGAGLTRCYVNAGSYKYCKSSRLSGCPPGEYCVLKYKACHRFVAATAFSGAKFYDCPGFRLPTEAEWEYAYRAGVTAPLYNGKSLEPAGCVSCKATQPGLDPIAWYCGNTMTIEFGGPPKLPNAWGLYNMAGNVSEWTHDIYQHDLGAAPVVDPVGSGAGNERVIRGGNFDDLPRRHRAAARRSGLSKNHEWGTGLRCVRTVKP